MMIRKLQSGPIAERARRSVREIALAVGLTLAAIIFLGAAIYSNGSETASIAVPQAGLQTTQPN